MDKFTPEEIKMLDKFTLEELKEVLQELQPIDEYKVKILELTETEKNKTMYLSKDYQCNKWFLHNTISDKLPRNIIINELESLNLLFDNLVYK